MIYFWVPVVAITGAVKARFRPGGMARALLATAIAQALVLAIALIIRDPQATPWASGVARGLGLNAFFGMLFVGSALLLRTAVRAASAEARSK